MSAAREERRLRRIDIDEISIRVAQARRARDHSRRLQGRYCERRQ
jgi:hypothetical protein